jgi:hypothetical protein
VDAAYRAGQISLQQGQQAISERAQTLSERMYQFQVQRDPSAPFQQAFAARELITPGGVATPSGAPNQWGQAGVTTPIRVLGQTTITPLTLEEAFTQNRAVSPAVRRSVSELDGLRLCYPYLLRSRHGPTSAY